MKAGTHGPELSSCGLRGEGQSMPKPSLPSLMASFSILCSSSYESYVGRHSWLKLDRKERVYFYYDDCLLHYRLCVNCTEITYFQLFQLLPVSNFLNLLGYNIQKWQWVLEYGLIIKKRFGAVCCSSSTAWMEEWVKPSKDLSSSRCKQSSSQILNSSRVSQTLNTENASILLLWCHPSVLMAHCVFSLITILLFIFGDVEYWCFILNKSKWWLTHEWM